MPLSLNVPLELRWIHDASSAIGRSLLAGDGSVIYGTKDGRIECIQTADGKKSGQIKIRGNFESTCALYDSALLVLRRLSQPALALYNLKTGKSVWTKEASSSLAEPLVVDDSFYITTADGRLRSYSLRDGKEGWSVKLDAPSHDGASFSHGLLVLGDDRGNVYAFNLLSELIWKTRLEGALVWAPTISDSMVFFGALDHCLHALDLHDGREKWCFQTGGQLYSGAAVNQDCIVFGSTDHQLYCLEKKTGKLVWSFRAGSVISTAPLFLNNIVLAGSLDKKIYALSPDEGRVLWEFEAKGRIRTDPVVYNGLLLFASEDNKLYCFGVK